MTSPPSTTEAARRFPELNRWTLFCFSIFALKILLFAIDPLPKFVMGDSGSYIWTALTGWIPDDRSYFHGYVIRWTSLWTESLTSLLLVQVCLSAITCILLASITRFIFKLPLRWSYLFGFLCAVDPLQLLWERYVMTETISLCLYAFVIYHLLLYLRARRLRDLAIMQAVSVLLIGFRISFLLQVEVNTVILPLIAFFPDALKRLQPISFMTLLVLALGTKAALRTVRRDKEEAMRDEQGIRVQSDPTLRSDVSGLAQPAFVGS